MKKTFSGIVPLTAFHSILFNKKLSNPPRYLFNPAPSEKAKLYAPNSQSTEAIQQIVKHCMIVETTFFELTNPP